MITEREGVRIGPSGLPDLTLGWDVLAWTAQWLTQPDGPNAGQPWRFTDEQARFVLWWYAVDEAGRFLHRRGVLRRMKGWGKDPVGATLCAVEFVGPCRFGGWKAPGVPEVIEHSAAWVQAAAVAKDQTKNTMTLFPGLFSKDATSEYGIDLGKEVIYAQGGRRRLEAVTSSPRAIEGARATFVLANETHHWIEGNEGHDMAEALRRNAAKSSDGASRVLSITNAHRIGEDSVAEREWEAYQKDPSGVLYDSLEAPPDANPKDPDSARGGVRVSRGDSVWLDVERIAQEMLDPGTSEAEGRRFYFNQLRQEKSGWLTVDEWAGCERVEEVPDGAFITLGFDGARRWDTTALVGTVIETGYQWVLGFWQRPEFAEDGWMLGSEEVTQTVAAAFGRYEVWRLYADPPHWEDTVTAWVGEHGAERVLEWWTNRRIQMIGAIRAFETAVRSRALGHEPAVHFARHIANCVKNPTGIRDERGGFLYTISKEGPNSPNKIDISMAAILSWKARLDAIEAGAKPAQASWSWGSA